jgi:hypothetical protein
LEDTLAEVTGEKESVWLTCPQSGKEPDMGNANVLRLLHDRVVKNHILGLCQTNLLVAGINPP